MAFSRVKYNANQAWGTLPGEHPWVQPVTKGAVNVFQASKWAFAPWGLSATAVALAALTKGRCGTGKLVSVFEKPKVVLWTHRSAGAGTAGLFGSGAALTAVQWLNPSHLRPWNQDGFGGHAKSTMKDAVPFRK